MILKRFKLPCGHLAPHPERVGQKLAFTCPEGTSDERCGTWQIQNKNNHNNALRTLIWRPPASVVAVPEEG